MCAGYAAGVHKCILDFHDCTVSSGADFDHFEEDIDDTLSKWVRIASVRSDNVCRAVRLCLKLTDMVTDWPGHKPGTRRRANIPGGYNG